MMLNLVIPKLAAVSRDLLGYCRPKCCHRIQMMAMKLANHEGHCGPVGDSPQTICRAILI